jgi:hypothetical protein
VEVTVGRRLYFLLPHLQSAKQVVDDLLLMVDVPFAEQERIVEVVRRPHPEAVAGGTEPTIPAFP